MAAAAEISRVDAVVVGAGAVGLACALSLAQRGLEVVALEAQGALGAGVSARSSEVIHAGLYYATGSLRARLCVEGRRRLYPWLEAHRVAHRRCGKLVVATDESEIGALERVYAQAQANGVEDIARLDGAQARAIEPAVSAVAAIWSGQSGVFDSAGYIQSLVGEIEALGGAVALASPMTGARPLDAGGFCVEVGGAEPTRLETARLVLAPGLGAQAAAASVEGYPAEAIPPRHLGKGVFFRLQGPAPFERLVYPVPIPGALGTHYRRDIWGQALFGPDLAFVETEDYAVSPEREASVAQAVRRFWPALPPGALVPDYAGIRPKIHGPGEAQPDFRLDDAAVHGLPGLIALFGIESPGLTASLALGAEVASRLGI